MASSPPAKQPRRNKQKIVNSTRKTVRRNLSNEMDNCDSENNNALPSDVNSLIRSAEDENQNRSRCDYSKELKIKKNLKVTKNRNDDGVEVSIHPSDSDDELLNYSSAEENDEEEEEDSASSYISKYGSEVTFNHKKKEEPKEDPISKLRKYKKDPVFMNLLEEVVDEKVERRVAEEKTKFMQSTQQQQPKRKGEDYTQISSVKSPSDTTLYTHCFAVYYIVRFILRKW